MADGQGVFGGYPPPVGTVPMLGRVPSGELIDSARHEPKLRTAEVIHSDMSWRRVSVLAWAVHRNGWAVLIRWPDGREDWRGYDRRYIRPALSLVVGGSGQLDRSRRHAGACSVRTGARVVSAVGTAGGAFGFEVGQQPVKPGWYPPVEAAEQEHGRRALIRSWQMGSDGAHGRPPAGTLINQAFSTLQIRLPRTPRREPQPPLAVPPSPPRNRHQGNRHPGLREGLG